MIRTGKAPVRTALRAVEARVRPDFRRAVAFGVLAFVLDGVAHGIGGVHAASLNVRVIAYACAAAFVIFGVMATRSAASEITRVSEARAGAAAATSLRVACLLIGYLTVLLVGLDLFAVPVGQLLVGGAVTGIILGIAAQQMLGNLFAGLVLLFSRPYIPGERIRVHSGALGGPFDGTVTTVGLLYTTLATAEGRINIPNSGLLGAAVGPIPIAPTAGAQAVAESAVDRCDVADEFAPIR
ncbi:MAG: small-conductance mechanosensitive channel-like protein [Pseudonocardiales bacterium]|nr:small-conductance mechanosensitive channel-like protein [Pseudonocardiales bacterium]